MPASKGQNKNNSKQRKKPSKSMRGKFKVQDEQIRQSLNQSFSHSDLKKKQRTLPTRNSSDKASSSSISVDNILNSRLQAVSVQQSNS